MNRIHDTPFGGNIGTRVSSIDSSLDGGFPSKGISNKYLHLLFFVFPSHLVLPLSGHNLAVGAGDGDTGVEACLVVGLHDMATKGILVADGAVVWALAATTRTKHDKTQTRISANMFNLKTFGEGERRVLIMNIASVCDEGLL